MKNKNIFNGFGTVFSFTAEQTIKGKGFKLATVGLFLLMFAIMAAVNVIIMFVMDEDDEEIIEPPTEEIIYETEDIYVFGYLTFDDIKDSSGNSVVVRYDNLNIEEIIKENYDKEVTVYEGALDDMTPTGELTDDEIIRFRENASEFINGKEKTAGILLYFDSEGDVIIEYLCRDWESSDGADVISYNIGCALKDYVMEKTGLTEEYIQTVNREYAVQTLKAGEEVDLAAYLIKMLAPMIVCLVLYMMVLLNGQSITKAIMAEKTSKLMETLLTSASPYAVIAGKVVAMATIAIGQMLFWIGGAVGGYFAGNAIAKSISPDFKNPINGVLDIIKEGAETAFSVEAVIIALVFMIVGFFMYCILAAFAASFANKADDMSNVATMFQMPVIIAFLIVYLAPLMENEVLLIIARYVPFTSPFGMPADVIVGNVSVGESLISLVLVIVATVVLILAAGKVYKDRVFSK